MLVSENCVYREEDQGNSPKSDRYFKEGSQYFIKETQQSGSEHTYWNIMGWNINFFDSWGIRNQLDVTCYVY